MEDITTNSQKAELNELVKYCNWQQSYLTSSMFKETVKRL